MPTGTLASGSLMSAFTFAELLVKKRFAAFSPRPSDGSILLGRERHILFRIDTFYLAWLDVLAPTVGEREALDFLYTAAREMGRVDGRSFIDSLQPLSTAARLASGIAHMAYIGLGAVEVVDDSFMATDETFFLHFVHPSTLEVEALLANGRKSVRAACLFSGGYAAGWCTEAVNLHLHTRELQCVAKGDERCEFIVATRQRLEEHDRRSRIHAFEVAAKPPA